jgi:hypothetical protein
MRNTLPDRYILTHLASTTSLQNWATFDATHWEIDRSVNYGVPAADYRPGGGST